MIPDLSSAAKPTEVENPLLTQIASLEILEGYWKIFNELANQEPQGQTSILEYPIVDPVANGLMKVIPLQNIPTFYGMTIEGPGAFLFEFDILCRGYDYTIEPKKLKLFPSTLKGAALRWFMDLGGCTINSWDDMKSYFLTKN